MSPHITWDLKQNWWMEQAFKYWFCLGSYQHVCVQCRDGVFHVGLELIHIWWEKSSFVRDIVSNKTFALFWQTLQLLGWWWSCYYLLQVITSGRKSWVLKIPTAVRPITGCTYSNTCSQSVKPSRKRDIWRSEVELLLYYILSRAAQTHTPAVSDALSQKRHLKIRDWAKTDTKKFLVFKFSSFIFPT